MVQLQRRGFLRGALALAALSLTVQEAFAGAPTIDRRALLKQAWREAKSSGRPMLVLLVPEQPEHFRGWVLGAWLNHGDDALMALLGGFVIVCVTEAELEERFGESPVQEDTWMVALHKLGAEVEFYPVNVPLTSSAPEAPGAPPPLKPWEIDLSDHEEVARWEQNRRARVEARDALVTQCLLDALPPHLRAPLPPNDAAKRARDAIERYREEAPPGVYWAVSTGCGDRIEGLRERQQTTYMCGMGHVSAWDRRYLYWNVPRTT